MRKRGTMISTFIFLFVVTLFSIFLLQLPFFAPLRGGLEWTLLPLQRFTHSSAQSINNIGNDQKVEQLKLENIRLQKKIVDQELLERDVKALRDQFASSTVPTQKLTVASVIGAETFIPGTQTPTTILIDKGSGDGITPGMAVIYKDSAVGTVSKTSPHLAKIDLSNNKSAAITAITSETKAIGVVKGTDDDLMLLDNVILSEKLIEGDIALTKGDVNENGHGYPKDLIIGKIISVRKEPSALFQTAEIKSLLDFSKLTTVFIVIN